ncbi:YozQ family protein [Aquibacillus sediminis]|uniref:YozQ family protein n=1 Tax=Aquibacillus sediminis TaxID=2574734 RepID=UPI001108D253|nr:YozQ family protein [Aquibacillus sediminis]
MAKDKRKQAQNAEKVAEKMYDPSYYNSDDQTDQGLAITHEQVSDDYMEGTIDGKIDDVKENGALNSKHGEDIPRKGYK